MQVKCPTVGIVNAQQRNLATAPKCLHLLTFLRDAKTHLPIYNNCENSGLTFALLKRSYKKHQRYIGYSCRSNLIQLTSFRRHKAGSRVLMPTLSSEFDGCIINASHIFFRCSSSRCWNPRSGRRVLCLTWLASFLYCWTASLVQIMLSKHMWPFADLLNKSTKCSGRVSLLSDSMVICQILPSLFDDGSTKQNFP